jgi:hypothetical protein
MEIGEVEEYLKERQGGRCDSLVSDKALDDKFIFLIKSCDVRLSTFQSVADCRSPGQIRSEEGR